MPLGADFLKITCDRVNDATMSLFIIWDRLEDKEDGELSGHCAVEPFSTRHAAVQTCF